MKKSSICMIYSGFILLLFSSLGMASSGQETGVPSEPEMKYAAQQTATQQTDIEPSLDISESHPDTPLVSGKLIGFNLCGEPLGIPENLTKLYELSLIHKLVHGDVGSEKDADGRYRLNADPALFKTYVLPWLQFGSCVFERTPKGVADAKRIFLLAGYLGYEKLRALAWFTVNAFAHIEEYAWLQIHCSPEHLDGRADNSKIPVVLQRKGDYHILISAFTGARVGKEPLRPCKAFSPMVEEPCSACEAYPKVWPTHHRRLCMAPSGNNVRESYNLYDVTKPDQPILERNYSPKEMKEFYKYIDEAVGDYICIPVYIPVDFGDCMAYDIYDLKRNETLYDFPESTLEAVLRGIRELALADQN